MIKKIAVLLPDQEMKGNKLVTKTDRYGNPVFKSSVVDINGEILDDGTPNAGTRLAALLFTYAQVQQDYLESLRTYTENQEMASIERTNYIKAVESKDGNSAKIFERLIDLRMQPAPDTTILEGLRNVIYSEIQRELMNPAKDGNIFKAGGDGPYDFNQQYKVHNTELYSSLNAVADGQVNPTNIDRLDAMDILGDTHFIVEARFPIAGWASEVFSALQRMTEESTEYLMELARYLDPHYYAAAELMSSCVYDYHFPETEEK